MTRVLRQPWIWSWLGALAVWLGIVGFTGGHGGAGVNTAALTFGAFYVLVALGQMFVVTLGPGNVDLSIPACMTLAGSFLSFLKLNPDWQIGAQGAILILVLALRVLIGRAGARA